MTSSPQHSPAEVSVSLIVQPNVLLTRGICCVADPSRAINSHNMTICFSQQFSISFLSNDFKEGFWSFGDVLNCETFMKKSSCINMNQSHAEVTVTPESVSAERGVG